MHIAIICHELTSRFNTSLEFADRLRKSGHRVTYITHADVGEVVQRAGHSYHRLTSSPSTSQQLRVPPLRYLMLWVLGSLRRRKETAADREIERAVESVDPDILLIDIEMHYAVIAVTRLAIPAVLYMNWFSIYRVPGIPPMNSRFLPTGEHTDAAEIRREWRRSRREVTLRRLRRKLGPAIVGDVVRPIAYTTYHYADLKAVAHSRGVDLSVRSDRRQWLEPLTFTDLPVLSFTAREMEFDHEPHPMMRYAGPMVASRRADIHEDKASRDALDDFLSTRHSGQNRAPLVYCSMGSYLTDTRFLRRVVDTFRRRSDWNLVLGLGRKASREEIGDVPESVLVLDWAPQLDVLAVADAAITHGGTSSIHECTANAVPMLVYPPGRRDLDQEGNAARVEHAGIGLRGNWNSDGPVEIERQLDQLLSDRIYKERLLNMRTVFENYRSNGVAVEMLEREYQRANPEERN